MRRVLAVLLAVVTVACLAVPLFAGKKDREYLDGVLLDEERQKKIQVTHHLGGDVDLKNYQDFYFTVHVGRVNYVGVIRRNNIFQYNPKSADWPPNKPVKVRFEKKGGLGLRTTLMYIQRPDGKEIETEVVSIIDDDGNQLCGKFKCG